MFLDYHFQNLFMRDIMSNVTRNESSIWYYGVPNYLDEITEENIIPAVERVNKIYYCAICSKESKSNSSSWKHVREKHEYRPLTSHEKKVFQQSIGTSRVELDLSATPIQSEIDQFVDSLPPFFTSAGGSSRRKKVTPRRSSYSKSSIIASKRQRKDSLANRTIEKPKLTRRMLLEKEMKSFLKVVQKDYPQDLETAEKVQMLILKLSKTDNSIARLLND